MYCPFCKVHPDTQYHSVVCSIVRTKVSVKGRYEDIFQTDAKIPAEISKTLLNVIELRNAIS